MFPTDFSKFDHSAPFWALHLVLCFFLPDEWHEEVTQAFYNRQWISTTSLERRVTSGLLSGSKLTSVAGSVTNIWYRVRAK